MSYTAELDNAQRAEEVGKTEWELFNKGFIDLCTIKLDDGQEFKIERKKLMAFSSVFETMFSSKMQETQTGIIKMKETSPDAIRALIHYLHVHKIEYPNETAFELYSLTDEYEILDLKNKCSQILISGLDKINVLERSILSITHNDEEFKSSILGYLTGCTQAIRELLKSDAWQKLLLEDKQLSDKIIDEII